MKRLVLWLLVKFSVAVCPPYYYQTSSSVDKQCIRFIYKSFPVTSTCVDYNAQLASFRDTSNLFSFLDSECNSNVCLLGPRVNSTLDLVNTDGTWINTTLYNLPVPTSPNKYLAYSYGTFTYILPSQTFLVACESPPGCPPGQGMQETMTGPQCKECPPGTFSSSHSMSACRPCPSGHLCRFNKTVLPVPAPPGHYLYADEWRRCDIQGYACHGGASDPY
jgi:hypothetical protein